MAENAGRAIGAEGTLGSGPVVPGPRGAGKLLRPVWPRCGAGCSETPSSPSSTVADNGRDSVPPSLLATALLRQFHDKVSDAEAKARADFDLRWKVALGIEVEDRPFAKSTLQVFRAQLILHDKVREVFESSLRLARESGCLKGRGMKVALDTTNILGRGGVKDTCNLLADGIVKLLRALAQLKGINVGQWAKSQDTIDTIDTWAPASRAKRPSTGATNGRGRPCWLGLWETRTGSWNYHGRRRVNCPRTALSGSGLWPRRNCWGSCYSRTWSGPMTEWASE